jgi:hypothetical protein
MDSTRNDKTRYSPRVNVPRSIGDVIRDVERIVERGERVLEELCEIERAVSEQSCTLPRRTRGPNPPAPKSPAPSLQNLHLKGMEKGCVVVSFDGGKRIAFPPALTELMGILASDESDSPDEFVAWKSFDRVGELLEKRLGRRFSHHNVSQLLSRLRGVFKGADLDARLIESSKVLGARLRLKRSTGRSPHAV